MPINKRKSQRVGFPKLYRAKLNYNELALSNVSTTVVQVHQFACNGMFDPNLSLGGSQPNYFDQLCSTSGIYSSYRVMGLSWKVTAEVVTSNACAIVWTGCSPKTNVIPGTPAFTLNADPNFRHKVAVHAQRPIILKGYTSAFKAAGLTRAQYNANEDTSAGGGANPVNLPTFNICSINTDLNTSTTVLFSVELVYYAQFFELRKPIPA